MTEPPTAVLARAADREQEGFADAARGNVTWATLFSADITATAGMCAGLAEVPPNGGTLAPHRHRQAEIYFVAEGTGVLIVEGAATTISAGMAVFIPGDAEHGVRNDGPGPLRFFYVFPTDRFADVVYRFSNQEP